MPEINPRRDVTTPASTGVEATDNLAIGVNNMELNDTARQQYDTPPPSYITSERRTRERKIPQLISQEAYKVPGTERSPSTERAERAERARSDQYTRLTLSLRREETLPEYTSHDSSDNNTQNPTSTETPRPENPR